MITLLLVIIGVIIVILLLLRIILMINKYMCRYIYKISSYNVKVIGFFHPYCDNGGGGERVLWMIIQALLTNDDIRENIKIFIYNGNNSTNTYDVINKAKKQFQIDLSRYSDSIIIVNIKSRFLLEPQWYPIATMICQCIASMVVGIECFLKLTPDIYIDTTGASFTYPLAKIICMSKTIAYVHYPIISSDMLKKVRDQRPSYNNNERIATNLTISRVKLLYYNVFAYLYKFVGLYADIVFVNSSWTYGHMSQLWKSSSTNKINLMYPPCNTSHLENIPLHINNEIKRERIIISIGQFRPEKDHMLQLESYSILKSSKKYDDVKLILVGSTRNKEDENIVNNLKKKIFEKDLNDNVEIKINTPFEEMYSLLTRSAIGLHTMWNEHFGISIVEMMAAGLVVVAHKSGGPLMDIVTNASDSNARLGYLAESAEEYADCMRQALDAYDTEANDDLRIRARQHIKKFSDEEFAIYVVEVFNTIL